MREFQQVDVFTATPYLGNPVAVVLDGQGLSTEQMRRFARWTNLSETTFVLPPTAPNADYAVRIFTPTTELPFAGHPTLGTCHAWLSATPDRDRAVRDPDTIVQECAAGLVTLRRTDGRLAFAAPPLIRSGPVDDALVARIVDVLGVDRADVVDVRWADNGPGWIAVLLTDAEKVLAVRPGFADDLYLGVAGPHPAGSPEALEVRAFFPVHGTTVEDPVTGSLNASLAQWLLTTGRIAAPYVAAQGTVLGRAGRIHVSADGDRVWIGGDTVTCVSGTVAL